MKLYPIKVISFRKGNQEHSHSERDVRKVAVTLGGAAIADGSQCKNVKGCLTRKSYIKQQKFFSIFLNLSFMHAFLPRI